VWLSVCVRERDGVCVDIRGKEEIHLSHAVMYTRSDVHTHTHTNTHTHTGSESMDLLRLDQLDALRTHQWKRRKIELEEEEEMGDALSGSPADLIHDMREQTMNSMSQVDQIVEVQVGLKKEEQEEEDVETPEGLYLMTKEQDEKMNDILKSVKMLCRTAFIEPHLRERAAMLNQKTLIKFIPEV